MNYKLTNSDVYALCNKGFAFTVSENESEEDYYESI